ncbi:MAG: prepilin peptidase [Chloroflexi bacterium]|nr:prepilin peptidase [Chloroflexota bacterium]MBI3340168.1 prepilin peptidase [Chloroflexota bacterium]
MIWLFMYALAISLYDLHMGRIPNWCTLPLLAAGVIAHFPERPEVWLASFALMYAWAGGRMGAGDVKLWIALLWALPVEQSSHSLLFMFISFLATGAAQIIWRVIKKQAMTDVKSPAAWRTIPFLLMLWYVH